MGTLRAMTAQPLQVGDSVVIEREHLEDMLRALVSRGYEVIGPTLREGAIVYDRLKSTEDLPAGWTDEQAGGKYRLKLGKDSALFGYVVGPHSWKKFLYPALQRLAPTPGVSGSPGYCVSITLPRCTPSSGRYGPAGKSCPSK